MVRTARGCESHQGCPLNVVESLLDGNNGREDLLLLMTILAKTFFTLVGGHFMAFTFFSAWHIGR